MADGEATQAREPARQGCQPCRTSVLTMADGSAHIARAGPGRGRGAGRPGYAVDSAAGVVRWCALLITFPDSSGLRTPESPFFVGRAVDCVGSTLPIAWLCTLASCHCLLTSAASTFLGEDEEKYQIAVFAQLH